MSQCRDQKHRGGKNENAFFLPREMELAQSGGYSPLLGSCNVAISITPKLLLAIKTVFASKQTSSRGDRSMILCGHFCLGWLTDTLKVSL